MSRLIPQVNTNSDINDHVEKYINFVARTAVPATMTATEIAVESEKDFKIRNLRVCIRSNDWARYKYPKYLFAKDELCEFNNIVMWKQN